MPSRWFQDLGANIEMNTLPDTIDFRLYMKETEAQTRIKQASESLQALKGKLRQTEREHLVYLPWPKTKDNFAFRRGEVTLWSGQNGHGKSLMTGEVALSLIGQGEKVCIASFEMKPEKTMHRMSRQWIGLNPYTPEFQQEDGIKALEDLYDQMDDWTKDYLWLYDYQGTADVESVIGMCKYCANELNIGHVFIDSLMKCVKNEDDYNGQKAFVDELTAIARDLNIHIHLVHHLKKPANENAVPDKHDNKGSGAITDQVDNVLMVWRNKVKEDDIKANGQFSQKKDEPDHYLLCRKQRNYDGSGEGEPTIKLWFHRDAQQYLESPREKPMFFPNYPHYPS
jgi:twinkle protein